MILIIRLRTADGQKQIFECIYWRYISVDKV